MRSEEAERGAVRMPASLGEMRDRVVGRDDATLHEGAQQMGVDPLIAYVVDVLIPAAFDPDSPAEPGGTVQFELSTPDGERHVSIARTAAGLEPRAGHATSPSTTVSMTLANFLRLLVNEAGRDAASQLASKAMHVTGDEALVKALPGWLRLPG